jgi:hypothetical protein
MIPRQYYQKKVDVLYTNFIDLELFSRTTKAVVCMLGGSVYGCTNTTRLLVHTLLDVLCVYIAPERAESGRLPDTIGLRWCSTYRWLYVWLYEQQNGDCGNACVISEYHEQIMTGQTFGVLYHAFTPLTSQPYPGNTARSSPVALRHLDEP